MYKNGIFLVIFQTLCTLIAFSQKERFITEASFAQTINGKSGGITAATYYKTRWPLAVRLGVTVTNGRVLNDFTTRYLQAGFMHYKNRMMYQAMAGFDVISSKFLGVYTAGAGYSIYKKAGAEVMSVLQLNYVGNKTNTFYNYWWVNAGLQICLFRKSRNKDK